MGAIGEIGDMDAGLSCTACGRPARTGAVYRGHAQVVLCGNCISGAHMLGILVGDAARSSTDLRRMLAAIERQAWESFALQAERRASGPRLIGAGDGIPY